MPVRRVKRLVGRGLLAAEDKAFDALESFDRRRQPKRVIKLEKQIRKLKDKIAEHKGRADKDGYMRAGIKVNFRPGDAVRTGEAHRLLPIPRSESGYDADKYLHKLYVQLARAEKDLVKARTQADKQLKTGTRANGPRQSDLDNIK